MSSSWITHVKQYAKNNKCSYKEALSKASATYKKGSGVCSSDNSIPNINVETAPTERLMPYIVTSVMENGMDGNMCPEVLEMFNEVMNRHEEELALRSDNQLINESRRIDTLMMDLGDIRLQNRRYTTAYMPLFMRGTAIVRVLARRDIDIDDVEDVIDVHTTPPPDSRMARGGGKKEK
jgi:hypothetical protein